MRLTALLFGATLASASGAHPALSDPASEARAPAESAPQAGGIAPVDYRPGAMACIAEAIYYESRGTSTRAGHAVAHVILNRRAHDEFPETVCAVVNEGCQFSYRCDGKPEALADVEERERAFDAAEAVLEGRADDPTDGALFFHSEEVQPGWFETRDPTVEIGGNIFYR